MAAFARSLLKLSLLCVALLYASTGQVMALKCYICHTDDNESCMSELRDCPTHQAFDRCLTTIYKNPVDGLHIKKDCGLAPCHLRGVGNINFAHFKSDCESSAQDCMYCCSEDGCNKDGAQGLAPVGLPLLCLTMLLGHLLRALPLRLH